MLKYIAALLVGLSALDGFAGDTIVLRADPWYPFAGDPKADKPGFMVEICKAVFEKAGYTVDFTSDGWGWERCVLEAREGKIDGIIGAMKEEAEGFVFPDEAAGVTKTAFYVKKGTAWRYDGIPSLKNVKLGTIAGYAYSDELDQYIKENAETPAVQVMQSDDALDLNIKKLDAGRFDATLEDESVWAAKVAELGLADHFDVAGKLSEPELLFIAFSPAKPTSAKYAKLLSDGIVELRSSGELAKILAKYTVTDWKK